MLYAIVSLKLISSGVVAKLENGVPNLLDLGLRIFLVLLHFWQIAEKGINHSL
jgi:hypothetical protein